MFSELWSGNKGKKEKLWVRHGNMEFIASFLGAWSPCFHRWDFLTCGSFPHLILLQHHEVLCCLFWKRGNITLSRPTGETNEVIEDAVSEALMPDHSLAIKHFVRRFSEVLSTRLIQLVRLISH